MRLAIASDHRGFELKRSILAHLKQSGLRALDLGTRSSIRPVDYTDYAEAVGLSISIGKAERGILICGSGVGVNVAANKIPGIRAGMCHDVYSAHQGVEHDDMNVLVLGASVVSAPLAFDLVDQFIRAKFDHAPRHLRRLEKMQALEFRHLGVNLLHLKKTGS